MPPAAPEQEVIAPAATVLVAAYVVVQVAWVDRIVLSLPLTQPVYVGVGDGMSVSP